MKYPRTFHLPWSLGITDDDKIGSTEHLIGKEIVVMEKMDGENTTIYPDGRYHARSLDSSGYPWQAPMLNDVLPVLYSESGCILKPNQRVCGENMYARHSIPYENLKSWFYAFSVWEEDMCLSFDDVLRTGFEIPPIMYEGVYDESILKEIASSLDTEKCEGYVVRNKNAFHYNDFKYNVMKFVRSNHVTTDIHWTKNWEPNKKINNT